MRREVKDESNQGAQEFLTMDITSTFILHLPTYLEEWQRADLHLTT
jgi:hypothetical protein